jgi:hypothetical protein
LETFLPILLLAAVFGGRLYLDRLADDCLEDLPPSFRGRASLEAFD